jgi:hypothetical protein
MPYLIETEPAAYAYYFGMELQETDWSRYRVVVLERRLKGGSNAGLSIQPGRRMVCAWSEG